MATNEAKYSLLVPLVAKSEKVEDVEKFLLAGYDLVKAEPETIQWFGIKFTSIIPQTYGIFDTFPTETGRGAHLTGEVAKALMANAPELLSPAPAIGQAEVLASVVRSTEHAAGDKTAGLSVGIRALVTAKAEKVQAVRDFLISAKALVEEEPLTPIWYAIEFTGTNQFGIVDLFPSEEGRNAHLNGKVAAALFASAEEFFDGAPDVAKFELLAAKVLV